jgi:ABC-type uncharacterized transport system auxiliary subunit
MTSPRARSRAQCGSAVVTLILFAIGLVACRSEPPPVEEYLLAAESKPATSPREGAPLPALRVRALVPRGFLDREPIAWREGDVRAGAYRYRRWSERPAETVTRRLIDALRVRGAFAQVDDATARPNGPFTLSGELLGLHETTDERGEHPAGVAELELVLEIAAPDGTVGPPTRTIFRARHEVAVADDSMESLVRAIGAALAQVFDELLPQVEAAAQAAPARATPDR